jgi:hypothetical protein
VPSPMQSTNVVRAMDYVTSRVPTDDARLQMLRQYVPAAR